MCARLYPCNLSFIYIYTYLTTHRRLILCNKAFTLERRVQLFSSLVLTQLTYGMESWVLHTRQSQVHLHNSIMKLYKRLLGCRPDAHMSDEDVLGELGAISPTVLLRMVRLRYLGLLYRNGGDDLWSLIQQDQQWQDLIHSDLQWMYQQLWNSSRLPDPATDLDHWETTMCSYPSYWKMTCETCRTP